MGIRAGARRSDVTSRRARSEPEPQADFQDVLPRLQVEARAAQVVVDLGVVDVEEAVAGGQRQGRAQAPIEAGLGLPGEERAVLLVERVERVAARAGVEPGGADARAGVERD